MHATCGGPSLRGGPHINLKNPSLLGNPYTTPLALPNISSLPRDPSAFPVRSDRLNVGPSLCLKRDPEENPCLEMSVDHPLETDEDGPSKTPPSPNPNFLHSPSSPLLSDSKFFDAIIDPDDNITLRHYEKDIKLEALA